jgi:phage-related protein
VYISLPLAVIVGFVSVETGSIGLANIAWEGNSREVLSDFPERVKQNLGFELWRLQQGDRPSDYRPCPRLARGYSNFALKMREPGIASFTWRGSET